jgi:hypothetical protein
MERDLCRGGFQTRPYKRRDLCRRVRVSRTKTAARRRRSNCVSQCQTAIRQSNDVKADLIRPRPSVLRHPEEDNAPPARSIAFSGDRKRTGGRFFCDPLQREGIERRKGAGARVAPWGARRLRSDAPMTPEGASAPKQGRTPPGALPRHFHESGFAHELLPDRGALLRALSQPGRCSPAGLNARRACPKPPRVPEVQAQARGVRRSPLRRLDASRRRPP